MKENENYYSKDDLKKTPSISGQYFKSDKEEILMRAKAARFIFDCGIELMLPQYTISTACVYMHRFYMFSSFKDNHVYNVSASCLFLACKVEETMRKLYDFILRVARISRKNPNFHLKETDKEYIKWHDVLLNTERQIVQILGFNLNVEHPYQHINTLFGQFYGDISYLDIPKLKRVVWSFVNDSYKSTVCLSYASYEIAVSCLIIAFAFLGIDTNKKMANFMRENDKIIECACRILNVYTLLDVRHLLEALFQCDIDK